MQKKDENLNRVSALAGQKEPVPEETSDRGGKQEGRKMRTTWNSYTLVFMGALVAMNLVMSRVLAIPIGGFGRLALGPVATILAGLWFGPAAGAVCGLSADLLGCLMQGYAPNPFITAAAMTWGLLPPLFAPGRGWSKVRRFLALFAGILITAALSTLVLTTTGLVVMYGYHFYAIFPTRLTQFAFMAPVYAVLVSILYFSPVTGIVRGAVLSRAGGKAVSAR